MKITLNILENELSLIIPESNPLTRAEVATLRHRQKWFLFHFVMWLPIKTVQVCCVPVYDFRVYFLTSSLRVRKTHEFSLRPLHCVWAHLLTAKSYSIKVRVIFIKVYGHGLDWSRCPDPGPDKPKVITAVPYHNLSASIPQLMSVVITISADILDFVL